MLGGFKRMLPRIAAVTATAMLAALSTVRVAFAASTDSRLPPEYTELLRLAQQKVQAATQPGAFGNGTPLFHDVMSILPWLGLAACAAVGAVVAAKILTSRMRSDALVAQ
ncbi:MAG: hypothetical protein E6K88_03815 [Thaumarchaeota archaeon]|nr:MAG: hypothetical protein E6K88_03815 [Nitrososphaerota archaeon]